MKKIAPIKKNEEHIAQIESLTNEGAGVCHIDGFAVFVPLTAVGDRVRIHIVKVNSSYGFGKVVEIIAPSQTRTEPSCPYFKLCGGCTLQHITYAEQLRIKADVVKDALKRIGGVGDFTFDGIIGMDEPYRYRNKMIFPFGVDNDGKPTLGFYAPRSHRVIPMDDCLLCGSVCRDIIKVVLEYATENGISVYDEEAHQGILRRLFIRSSHVNGSVMVVICANAKKLPNADALVDKLIATGVKIESIILNINREKTNLVLGSRNITLYGNDVLCDELCGNEFEISPHSFFQVNPTQTQKLYQTAIDYAIGNGGVLDTVFDIYCGIGTISLAMAKHAKKIIGVEIVDVAIENAKQNALANNISNAEFYAGPAEELVPQLVNAGLSPDVVILDPPRKGSDEKTLGAIVKAEPTRVVYVSCNPSTLARDVKYLTEQGYTLQTVTAVDMFPHTNHVESVCLLSKVDTRGGSTR